MSLLSEFQLTHMSLNFKTSCCNLKIGALGKNMMLIVISISFFRNFVFELNFTLFLYVKRPDVRIELMMEKESLNFKESL